MVNFSLEGKIALVTGASYGIGCGIASGNERKRTRKDHQHLLYDE